MITVTRDPITLNDVKDLAHAPCLVEGRGDSALKIYFESEASKQEYLDMETHSEGQLVRSEADIRRDGRESRHRQHQLIPWPNASC